MTSLTNLGRQSCFAHLFFGDETESKFRVDDGSQSAACNCAPQSAGMTATFRALVLGAGNAATPMRVASRVDYRYTFRFGTFETGLLTFDKREQFDIEPQPIGRAFEASEFGGLPVHMHRLAEALAKAGFRVTGPVDMEEFHRHQLRTILMVRGKRLFPDDPQRPAVDGVRVELSYIVD